MGLQVEAGGDDADDKKGDEDDAAALLGGPAVAVAAIGVCGAELEALEGGV